MTKEFAPQYPRNDRGWILFPTHDVKRRKELWSQEVFQHPAKANIHLIESLIEYLTELGDTILDPFGGTGTIMLAALMGRKVITIELEETYQKILLDTQLRWSNDPDLAGELSAIANIQGDCRLILPVPCDHVIFSPPYSTALGRSTGLTNIGKVGGETWGEYSAHSLNLGRLNPFLYSQAMRTVYRLLSESVCPGGSMAVITKDITRGPDRVFLSEGCIRMANEAGFRLEEWYKWRPSGSAQAKIMRSKGAYTIEDEDIIIFRRE